MTSTISAADGVTTVSGADALPYTAALVFHVGASDETVRTTGISHLVEHLVMAAQPRSPLDVNATVDSDITVFHATGDQDAVESWLAGICATLADLPLDRLETEVMVLDAEDGTAVAPALAWAAGVRFGSAGAGVVGRSGAPHRTLTREQAAEHVRRYFTRDNVVLVSTGEPSWNPATTLPTGSRPRRAGLVVSGPELPAYVAGPPVAVVSFETARAAPAQVFTQLLQDHLMQRLRHDRGLVYDVGSDVLPLGEDHALVAVWADGRPEDIEEILRTAAEFIRAVATDGAHPDDLAHQKAVARSWMTDPRGTLDYLVAMAQRHLEGRPVRTVQELVDETEVVTPTDVREVARQAARSLLLGGPEPVDEGVAGVPDRSEEELPESPPFEGRRFRRRLLGTSPLDLRLDLNDDGIAQTVLGRRSGGRWADVVGVAKGPDFRAVVFVDGSQVVVWPRSLRGGAEAAAEIDRRAGDLVFEVDADWL